MSNKQCVVPQASQDPDMPGFEMREAPIPTECSGDSVLIKVLASGVCHSDTFTVVGGTGVNYPGIPGHEVVGKVVKTGPGAIAQTFAEGTIVGVGWHGSHCFTCESCTDGDFVNCEKATITGVSRPGGYQEYAVVEASALARSWFKHWFSDPLARDDEVVVLTDHFISRAVPDGMDPTDAAPLMCAGVTVFNGLRANISKAQPPALVAVVGIGGLGHVAIQYAAKFGYTVVAISRGTKKKAHAMELGATHYIDSTAENVAQALMALGGAKVVLCTATNAKSMGDCIDGLSRHGRLVVLGASTDDIPVSPLQLIVKSRAIVGHLTGSARDSQDAMEFAHKHGIKPSKVMFDGIEKAPDAYAAMRRGEYRVVIKL